MFLNKITRRSPSAAVCFSGDPATNKLTCSSMTFTCNRWRSAKETGALEALFLQSLCPVTDLAGDVESIRVRSKLGGVQKRPRPLLILRCLHPPTKPLVKESPFDPYSTKLESSQGALVSELFEGNAIQNVQTTSPPPQRNLPFSALLLLTDARTSSSAALPGSLLGYDQLLLRVFLRVWFGGSDSDGGWGPRPMSKGNSSSS